MKLGLQVYRFDWNGSPENIGSKLTEIAQTAENVGFSSFWVMDHLFQLGGIWGEVDAPMLEGYTTISYIAAVTNNLKIGLMVTGSTHRYPGMLIKALSTIDVLSGGRTYLGIGAGWYRRESEGLGIPVPSSIKERIERFEEILQIAKHMWSGNQSDFKGKYYHLIKPINSPQPLSKPHPPILIGFEGEKVMPKIAARYADAVNLHVGTPLKKYPKWMQKRYHNIKVDLKRKLDIIQLRCDEIGRIFDEIETTCLATIKIAPDAMKTKEVVELCHDLADIGFQHVIFNMPNVYEIEPINLIGQEVIPKIKNL
jgi:hypothetical protein